MPRTFSLVLPDGSHVDASLTKFTRGDIYGVKRREKRDLKGNPLKKARITEDGFHLIPDKGTSMQWIDDEGHLVDRSATIPATPEGEPCLVVESMFSTGVHVSETITLEEYLHHDIDRTYVLQSDASLASLHDKCVSLLDEERLFTFTYAWMVTHDPSTAILLPFQGAIVVAVGKRAGLKWVGPDTRVLSLFEDIIEDEEFDFEEAW